MLTPAPYSGSFDELRARWLDLLPSFAHSVRPFAFDADGTLRLAVLGQMSGVQWRTLVYQALRAIAVLDGVRVRRVRCRRVSQALWESL